VKKNLYNFLENIYEVGGNSSNRILPMEGLRGVAVILVFFVHYHALFSTQIGTESITYKISKFLEANGNSGVDLFFVLSGYLIYGAVIKKFEFGTFLKRRVQRIYPAFLFVFAIYLVVSYVSPEKSKIPGNATDAIIYILQNIFLLPGIFDIPPIITVAWSLSYEFFFYLLLPLVVIVFSLQVQKPSHRVVFFVGATVICLIYSFLGNLPNLKLLMFVAGILLYEAVKNFEFHKYVTPKIDYLVIAVFFISLLLVNFLINMPEAIQISSVHLKNVSHLLILFITFFLLVLACIGSSSVLKTVFSWTPLRWLGNMSYSYYLIHGFTLHVISVFVAKFLAQAFTSQVVFWVAMPIFFALTWLSSTMLFVLVEKPFSLNSIKQTPKNNIVLRTFSHRSS
jgi:peptidoglycan/LPS O-acetylase OafA/YrhL